MAKKTAVTSLDAGAIPQYVLDHAPLLHLFSSDPYRPSSIAATLNHTHPELNFKPVSPPLLPLTLDNLDQLNGLDSNTGKDIYLTSNENVTTDPAWLKGIQVNSNGGTGDEKTGVIVVVDKGQGIVDTFYFYFFAFNWGGIVLGKQLGDHVGDWEHNMIRFINGIPTYVWLSQHSNGEAFTFSALQKDSTGKRPIVYAANGSHAIYPVPGTHDHTIPNLNLPTPLLLVDNTDAGPIYDPILSSYTYTYDPATATFTPASPDSPTAFLRFNGRWGDAEYPADDPRQKGRGLFGFKKYVGGPTGPADKQLGRKEVWPDSQFSKGQRIRNSLDGKTWVGDLVKGCFGAGKMKAVKAMVSKGKAVKRVDVSGKEVGK